MVLRSLLPCLPQEIDQTDTFALKALKPEKTRLLILTFFGKLAFKKTLKIETFRICNYVILIRWNRVSKRQYFEVEKNTFTVLNNWKRLFSPLRHTRLARSYPLLTCFGSTQLSNVSENVQVCVTVSLRKRQNSWKETKQTRQEIPRNVYFKAEKGPLLQFCEHLRRFSEL